MFVWALRALARSHETRWVGSLILDTVGRILEGAESRGVCKSTDPCLFLAKSVDPPKCLLETETSTTSENRSVKVQR